MDVMENIRIVLGKNLKARRKVLSMNQEQLAEKSKLSLGYVKDIERGLKWPSPESFEALASGLGTTVGVLLNEEPPKVIELPVSSAFKKVLKIPDRIYDLAEKISVDNDVWDAIEGLLEDEIEYGQKDAGKAKA